MINKDKGFVLKRFNFRETSVIATIYTFGFGKIKGIFKGFYGKKKEFSTSLDIFSLNEFIFYPKENEIWLVSEAGLINDFSYLRKDLVKAEAAGFIFHLLDKTTQLWDVNKKIFRLICNCMNLLENEPEKAFYIFLIKFLTLAGVKPDFNHCIACRREIEGNFLFSTRRGGLLCRSCCSRDKNYHMVSKEASKTFSYIQKSPIAAAGRVYLSRRCQDEISNIIKKFLSYHFDLPVLNRAFFEDRKIVEAGV